MGDAGMMEIDQEDFSFGDHELQKLSVFNPFSHKLTSHDGVWIVYIHGGAWRDPKVTQTSLLPTIKLLADHSLRERLTAFASLSYRLSAHPDYPQVPLTSPSKLRDAKHPDHLVDVLEGIEFLQKKYGFGNNYVLVGHSCGATLAFQTLMGIVDRPITLPRTIVGVAGIYDLRLLRDRNPHPAYQSFLVGAFGADEKVWDELSPARYQKYGDWDKGELVVLASSTGDELVDESQIERMHLKLMDQRNKTGVKVETWKDMLEMKHNAIWESTNGLAKVIGRVLEILLA